MRRDEVTGSKNYNADDLIDGDLNLTIADVTQEEFKAEDGYKQKKLVVSFRGKDKRLVCGKTKANALFDMLGEETDDWVGQRIRLTIGKTTYAGRRVNSVEVAPPLAPRSQAAPARTRRPAEVEDEEEPAPAPAPRKRQTAPVATDDEVDSNDPPF